MTFKGGAGDDAYYVSSSSHTITENAGEGIDAVYSTATAYTLGANLEILTFTGSGNFTGTGNALANTITGGAGSDTLIGAAGADVLDGAGGDNTASYATSTTGVLANLANSAANTGDAAGDVYIHIENLFGGAGTDTLIGDALNNTLSGGSGMDVLIGGAGADVLNGADGGSDGGIQIDTASYSTATAGVRVDLTNLANNTGDAAGDTYTSIEAFQGSAYNDTFVGAAGVSMTFKGGAGDDAYYVSSSSHTITENAGEGTDKVYTTLSTYTLGANVEVLTFAGSGNFAGTGNSAANTITGGAGDDTLIGGAGADVLDGAGGANTASYASSTSGVVASLANPAANTGDAAGDTYTNIQNLIGNGYADSLVGDSQDNLLSGGSGADTIFGGLGADTLKGDAGADRFVYGSLVESPTTAADVIYFNTSEGDKIDVSAIDADATVAGNQAFHLDGTSGGAGDISFYYSGALDATVVNLWVDNDATIDMTIYLRGNVSLTSANFVL